MSSTANRRQYSPFFPLCVITFSDKAASSTTAKLSYVINAGDEEQEQREEFVKMRFATGDRRVGLHGN